MRQTRIMQAGHRAGPTPRPAVCACFHCNLLASPGLLGGFRLFCRLGRQHWRHCMYRTWSRYGLAVLLISIVGATPVAFAQNPTFALEGVVTDSQQAVLPGATVTVENTSTGLTRSVPTDDGGRWVIRGLPPEGRYKMQVELQGFATEVREGLIFNAG